MSKLTAPQAIKRYLLLDTIEYAKGEPPEDGSTIVYPSPEDFNEGSVVDAIWAAEGNPKHPDFGDWLWQALEEFRGSGEESGLGGEWNRNYETKGRARKLPDGTWVGWTYWYGGGKHGNAHEIPWIDDAYYVTMREETRVVRTFSMKDDDVTPEST